MNETENNDSREKNTIMDDTPPFFRSWRVIYGIVLACLALMIILFYWFSISFK